MAGPAAPGDNPRFHLFWEIFRMSDTSFSSARFYPVGQPGQAWGAAEVAQWRARQQQQRSYDEVLAAIQRPRPGWEVHTYGQICYGQAQYPVLALVSVAWQADAPSILVTGGVHGYETSGVLGALAFADGWTASDAQQANVVVAPCISPWGWEHVQRWNYDAIDPNRSFYANSPAQESRALMAWVAALTAQHGQPFSAHIDLHETTDSDENEFRPALAARDGKPFIPGSIPDGFYVVDDTECPQPDFQAAIIGAVGQVTHIAPADADGQIIGSPVVAPGVIRYRLKEWGLCASVTGAPYICTTEVYPDSPRTHPQECVDAQVASVRAAIKFIVNWSQTNSHCRLMHSV